MKRWVLSLLAGVAATGAIWAAGSEKAAEEMKPIIARVQEKVGEGRFTEADLEPEIKDIEKLAAKFDKSPEDAAHVLMMEALLYFDVIDDSGKGAALVRKVQKEYPNTEPGRRGENLLAALQQRSEARKISKQLKVGSQFPEFETTDLDGKPLTLASFKGKPVLIDFWATWCGPCVRELPSVIEAYQKFHGKGFEVIGISLDESETQLKAFLKKNDMTWPQSFDGKGWQNALAAKYGIRSIPATFLLDGEGRIIAKDLRGSMLSEKLAQIFSETKTVTP